MRAQDPRDSPRPGSDEPCQIRVRRESTGVWVTPIGELDLATAQEFDRVVWDVQTGVRWLTIDLRALTFIDAAGIRSLIGAQLRASSWHRRLEVICGPGQVQRMLTLTGVDDLLGVVTPAVPRVPRSARPRRPDDLRVA